MNYEPPKFADGDLVAHVLRGNCYGYIQEWSLHEEAGSIYKVFDGEDTFWQQEAELRPVSMVFCPLSLKWLMSKL